MARHTICDATALEEGKITQAEVGRRKILLSRLPSGEIRAFSGKCPHQGADLAFGCISGTTKGERPNEITYEEAGEFLRCPWHGFEFSLLTGEPAVHANPGSPMKLRFYDVEVDNGKVVVVL